MQRALAGITAGDFTQRVEVPNRDEFGRLARDLNGTSERLAQLFEEQRALAGGSSETNASLARASEAKSRFLASVSHELRTPMNAILGFTDALLAGVDGPLNAEQKASLGWVQRGGRDLLGLINEILDLSKIEAGKLTLDAEPFDPRELVESVVAQHRSLAAQKGIRLGWHDAGAPAEVVLDRQRVRQILVNLVGNALKFTDEGEVQVETSGAADGRSTSPSATPGRGIAAERARSDLRGVPPGRGRPERAPAWGSRSAGGWRGRWAATSRSRASPAAGARSTSPCRSTAGPLPVVDRPARADRAQRRRARAAQRRRRPVGRAAAAEDARRPRLPGRRLDRSESAR